MAANVLWAHLLRKDATTTDIPSQIPPIAPQDKTGTTMRMLIHDTQVNLEKFSTRLDSLLQRVDDCRAQVVNTNKLLDVERDKMLTEVLGIANKCQSEMKAYVGTPAQATALDLVRVSHVSTEKSVQALERRIDALQILLQTHAHVMQSIQDQQNTLIGTILPLVPIFHGLPAEVEQIKVALSDMMANAVSTMTNSFEGVRSTLAAELAPFSARVGSSVESMSSSRRKRSNASALGPHDTTVSTFSPLDSRGRGASALRPKRPRLEAVPLTGSSDPPPLLRTPRTPGQPLSDVLSPPGRNIPRTDQHLASCTDSTSHESMRPLRPTTPPPLQPCEQVPSDLQDRIDIRRFEDMPFVVNRTAQEASDQDTFSKTMKIEDMMEPNLSGVISIHSSPLSSLRSSSDARAQPGLALSHLVESNVEGSPPKSMSLRDRRALMSRFGRTETRRFIPVVPWSDEEE